MMNVSGSLFPATLNLIIGKFVIFIFLFMKDMRNLYSDGVKYIIPKTYHQPN